MLRWVGNSVNKCALGMMRVPCRCLDSICHVVAPVNQEAIWTMYTGKRSCGGSVASQVLNSRGFIVRAGKAPPRRTWLLVYSRLCSEGL